METHNNARPIFVYTATLNRKPCSTKCDVNGPHSCGWWPAPPVQQQAKAAVTDPSFPRIDSQIQKRRDQDRLQILLEEVRAEESRLSELRREYQNGEPERLGSERNYAKYQERVAQMKDDILRTEKNIEALRREIGQLK